jgi:hypothetical protein
MRYGSGSALWPGRLRWRLRAASQWPLFALLTVVDAVLLVVLPISGAGTGFVSALLLAMFFNLTAVAALGRLAGWWVRRRRPQVPKVVAEDRAGVALLSTVTVALVVGGVLHAPGADEARRALRAQREAVRAYVLAHGGPVHRAHLGAMDTAQHSDDFFRTCVPGDAARGVAALCLLIDTRHDPPLVHVDRDRSPNRRP